MDVSIVCDVDRLSVETIVVTGTDEDSTIVLLGTNELDSKAEELETTTELLSASVDETIGVTGESMLDSITVWLTVLLGTTEEAKETVDETEITDEEAKRLSVSELLATRDEDIIEELSTTDTETVAEELSSVDEAKELT
jgi:hypothetical protein